MDEVAVFWMQDQWQVWFLQKNSSKILFKAVVKILKNESNKKEIRYNLKIEETLKEHFLVLAETGDEFSCSKQREGGYSGNWYLRSLEELS